MSTRSAALNAPWQADSLPKHWVVKELKWGCQLRLVPELGLSKWDMEAKTPEGKDARKQRRQERERGKFCPNQPGVEAMADDALPPSSAIALVQHFAAAGAPDCWEGRVCARAHRDLACPLPGGQLDGSHRMERFKDVHQVPLLRCSWGTHHFPVA